MSNDMTNGLFDESQAIPSRVKDLTGRVFGMLTVKRYAGVAGLKRRAIWECVCECGAIRILNGGALTSGNTKGCGKCRYHVSDSAYAAQLEKRILQSVVVSKSGCWEWNKFRDRDGYGLMRVREVNRRVSHVSYRLFVGEIPSGMWVLHKCDNPCCCNPTHLFLGTHSDNMADKKSKGRQYRPEGENHQCSKLTQLQVDEIRQEYKKGKITQLALGKKYGVSDGTICRIVKHRGWKAK